MDIERLEEKNDFASEKHLLTSRRTAVVAILADSARRTVGAAATEEAVVRETRHGAITTKVCIINTTHPCH